MGDWTYYIVRMKMNEIAHEIQFAHDIHEDRTLNTALQRVLDVRRVKQQIVGFLAHRPDRFFSSIVVAATDGEPYWFPVEMDVSKDSLLFAQTGFMKDAFGILCFGDEPKYYALDGQHRVAAIKHLLDPSSDVQKPQGFDQDMMSVLIVIREEHDDLDDREWLRRHRRLFSSLNRYARKTDRDTDIIMDEDDIYAILTRRLLTHHEFFRSSGRQKDSLRVQTKGKNLRKGVPHFTTLQTLYAITEILLVTRAREIKESWQVQGGRPKKNAVPNLTRRPNEGFIGGLQEELMSLWDAILAAFPRMREEPAANRQHDPHVEGADLLYFWPVGQELLARAVRTTLDDRFCETGSASAAAMAKALEPLAAAPWDLFGAPWKHFLLVPPAGRNRKLSSLHSRLRTAGAVFGAYNGWERANYFAGKDDDVSREATRTWDRNGPWEIRVREECEAVRDGCGMIAITGFTRLAVEGPGARDWLDGLMASRMPPVGKVGLAYFPDARGRILTEMSVIPRSDDRIWLITAAAAQWHDGELLRRRAPEDIAVRDRTDRYECLLVTGPRSREALAAISDADLSKGWLGFQEATVAGHRWIPLAPRR